MSVTEVFNGKMAESIIEFLLIVFSDIYMCVSTFFQKTDLGDLKNNTSAEVYSQVNLNTIFTTSHENCLIVSI